MITFVSRNVLQVNMEIQISVVHHAAQSVDNARILLLFAQNAQL